MDTCYSGERRVIHWGTHTSGSGGYEIVVCPTYPWGSAAIIIAVVIIVINIIIIMIILMTTNNSVAIMIGVVLFATTIISIITIIIIISTISNSYDAINHHPCSSGPYLSSAAQEVVINLQPFKK